MLIAFSKSNIWDISINVFIRAFLQIAVVVIVGAGIEYNIYDKIFGSLNFDRIGYCRECLNIDGGGLSGSHYRVVFGITYFFELIVKVPPAK